MGSSEPELPDAWSQDIERLFGIVRTQNNLTYGCWVVEHVPSRVIVPHPTANLTYTDPEEGWRVRDLNGTTIVVVKNKALADLIGSLPDLCDTDIRPSSGGAISCQISGKRQTIPFAGTANPQEAFDTGYRKGFEEGEGVGYQLAVQELDDDEVAE
tara:strand:+ start:535 stop:1002 length:468 start_codon:yes stop_codon:yes gene_type:complete